MLFLYSLHEKSIVSKTRPFPHPRDNIVTDENQIKPDRVPNGLHGMMNYVESEMIYDIY